MQAETFQVFFLANVGWPRYHLQRRQRKRLRWWNRGRRHARRRQRHHDRGLAPSSPQPEGCDGRKPDYHDYGRDHADGDGWVVLGDGVRGGVERGRRRCRQRRCRRRRRRRRRGQKTPTNRCCRRRRRRCDELAILPAVRPRISQPRCGFVDIAAARLGLLNVRIIEACAASATAEPTARLVAIVGPGRDKLVQLTLARLASGGCCRGRCREARRRFDRRRRARRHWRHRRRHRCRHRCRARCRA
mmetsp:Transcript_138813/g.442763  ORF Transcript_138813/g.442763 Transcript_138813/m.442763 type:complete len:245 (+) Transcript_138813:937-1671(+)